MADAETESEYKQRFIRRVAEARVATGMTQQQIADGLHIPQDKYKQYERRSLLPHHLIDRFCIIVRVNPIWLITSRGKKPLQTHRAVASETPPVAKPKRARVKRIA